MVVDGVHSLPPLRTLGIDVGIVHLGLAIVEGCFTSSPHPVHLDLIDLTQYGQSRQLCDRVNKFLQKHDAVLQNLDGIFIEQQPPHGIQAVEQLLLHHLRRYSTVQLVSPHIIQKWLGTRGWSYEDRKLGVEAWCYRLLLESPHEQWRTYFTTRSRRHDVADATALAFYGWGKLAERQKQDHRLHVLRQNGFDLSGFAFQQGKRKG